MVILFFSNKSSIAFSKSRRVVVIPHSFLFHTSTKSPLSALSAQDLTNYPSLVPLGKLVYPKNSFWVKSMFTPAAARTPSAAAIINLAGAITEASPAAYTP